MSEKCHYQTSTAQTLDERRMFNGTALPTTQSRLILQIAAASLPAAFKHTLNVLAGPSAVVPP